ncbi:hypothetical protein I7I53_10164 [Histoplasma capsulatum var. duboisii H88]|uniref:Uncharacterized protein n=1 Tax=Ajellomyces capsulatus (strain H88) TaxID=544711 RepID=A0A8A1LCI2_AJEC8|nr:hypothetical protein I7I53_10164 [Histoplasma capsulatum var. duboisii H88]
MCLISCIFRESLPCICYLRIQGSIKDGHFTSSMTYRSIQIQLKRSLNPTWTSFHLIMILPLVIFSSIGSKSFRQLSSQKRFQMDDNDRQFHWFILNFSRIELNIDITFSSAAF